MDKIQKCSKCDGDIDISKAEVIKSNVFVEDQEYMSICFQCPNCNEVHIFSVDNKLTNKICKELNIQTDNPSMYLEKEGWLKYTTDYVLNSDDKEINDKQLNTLRKFLKTPNKLKKEGKIRIGNYMSPYVDISEFDTMDKYSFEYRKKHNRR